MVKLGSEPKHSASRSLVRIRRGSGAGTVKEILVLAFQGECAAG